MAKQRAIKKRKPLKGVRVPLPKQTGGKHKVKTKYDRKRVGKLLQGLGADPGEVHEITENLHHYVRQIEAGGMLFPPGDDR